MSEHFSQQGILPEGQSLEGKVIATARITGLTKNEQPKYLLELVRMGPSGLKGNLELDRKEIETLVSYIAEHRRRHLYDGKEIGELNESEIWSIISHQVISAAYERDGLERDPICLGLFEIDKYTTGL